jgi:DNA-binding NarL/FixJ family response regulator
VSKEDHANAEIRALLADPDPLIRLGLRALLEQADDVQIVAEAHEGQEAMQLIQALLPNVALLDIRLAGTGVVQIAKAIRSRELPTHVLVLGSDADDPCLYDAVLAGARGALLKQDAEKRMVRAVRTVARGDSWFSPGIPPRLAEWARRRQQRLSQTDMLTRREIEVLRLLAQGSTNLQIAHTLGITERTVRFHLGNVYRKLNLNSRTEASVWAVLNGLTRQVADRASGVDLSE